ncbi:MAG: carboxysome shell carbonic anhydrase [Sulfuriferula multivorans]|uniref:Carboxysome shell carbonic anhydrase n=1 Tax=Sulfuriferula multivorans TaxID=1559896 RepID=A0A7C9P8M7_9PROT|nr:carboxysome shell carbonic anhydrase [Sulfuriferula multivorans]
MRTAEELCQPESLDNLACVIGSGQRCEHALVDQELNRRLYAYENLVRGRFSPIVDTLKTLSAFQHEMDFVARAQRVAQDKLGYTLPLDLLENAWSAGLDLRALHSYCVFRSFKECIDQAAVDQLPWRDRMLIDAAFIQSCGYHTLDISPCADGRLQGLLPFVFRMASNDAVYVKAYAGALFDVEGDVADWTQRELLRLAGGIPGGESGNYLKIAVYHYSTSNPCQQGCAAHGSNDGLAKQAATDRLAELRGAIENTYGRGAAPDTLMIGMDTDTDAIRVHLPDSDSANCPMRFVESAGLFHETLGMSATEARSAVDQAIINAEKNCGLQPGMRKLITCLLEANLSQIQYVIQHHEGRYAVIGHNERFICAGEAMSELQLRNKFYFAHLDTVEEGAPDIDVGIKIFSGLNIARGLAVPVLVHFHYSSRVPGARERAVARCQRVQTAIQDRYSQLHLKGMLHCQMAVSDSEGSERCTFIDDVVQQAGH